MSGTSGVTAAPAMADLRHAMVDSQLRTYDVTDRNVLSAVDSMPRELFVPAGKSAVAYLDQPVRVAADRFLLTPMVFARMLQTLAVKPGDRVLDYACATGYSSAVIAALGASVSAVESDAALAAAAREALDRAGASTVTIAPTTPADGAFDAIFVNGACETRPDALLERLAEGGRLVCVLGGGRSGRVMLYQRSGATISGRAVFDAAAPLLAEFRQPARFVF